MSEASEPGQLGHRLLIVDDTPANIDLLTAALEPRGYEILAAPGGEAGLKIALNGR